VASGFGSQSVPDALNSITGYEAMNIISKGQIFPLLPALIDPPLQRRAFYRVHLAPVHHGR